MRERPAGLSAGELALMAVAVLLHAGGFASAKNARGAARAAQAALSAAYGSAAAWAEIVSEADDRTPAGAAFAASMLVISAATVAECARSATAGERGTTHGEGTSAGL